MLKQRTWTNENNEISHKNKKQAQRTRYQQQGTMCSLILIIRSWCGVLIGWLWFCLLKMLLFLFLCSCSLDSIWFPKPKTAQGQRTNNKNETNAKLKGHEQMARHQRQTQRTTSNTKNKLKNNEQTQWTTISREDWFMGGMGEVLRDGQNEAIRRPHDKIKDK